MKGNFGNQDAYEPKLYDGNWWNQENLGTKKLGKHRKERKQAPGVGNRGSNQLTASFEEQEAMTIKGNYTGMSGDRMRLDVTGVCVSLSLCTVDMCRRVCVCVSNWSAVCQM